MAAHGQFTATAEGESVDRRDDGLGAVLDACEDILPALGERRADSVRNYLIALGVQPDRISTVSFGTPYGYVEINEQRQPVPVDDEMLAKIAELSGGEAFTASSLEQLKEVFSSLQQQIGYETIKGDASVGWLRLGAVILAFAALAALLINRRLPG